MKKILVPIDFSATSLNALEYAINYVSGEPHQITILHTYEVVKKTGYLKSMDNVLESDAERQMSALLKRIKEKYPEAVFVHKIIKGDAVDVISSYGNSESESFDLVIMGTKGASGLKEVFIGSVAGGVIAYTRAPVVVVPDGCSLKKGSDIVLAVSGLSLSSPKVLDPLREVLETFDAKLRVLHIANETTDSITSVIDLLDDVQPSVVYAFGEGDINDRINAYIKEANAGLLCMIRQSRGYFKRIFGKSVTLKQTFDSAVPLLVLHN